MQRPLTHEEIRSIIHQPVDGYFSNEEDDMLSAANQTPYYYHHGVNVEWSRWDVSRSLWWIRDASTRWTCKGVTYWCFTR